MISAEAITCRATSVSSSRVVERLYPDILTQKAHLALSKPVIDVGFFTTDIDATLGFWRNEFGLACEPPVHFNEVLTQYRHAFGNSIIKINTSDDPLANTPTGYRSLLLYSAEYGVQRDLTDPDGNVIKVIPDATAETPYLGLEIAVAHAPTQARFYADVLGYTQAHDDQYCCGTSPIVLTEDPGAANAGHWIGPGLRYFTMHVMRVDDCFEQVVRGGATVGEAPYSIGEIARISFVRDPHDNWIEIAQRAELAGPW